MPACLLNAAIVRKTFDIEFPDTVLEEIESLAYCSRNNYTWKISYRKTSKQSRKELASFKHMLKEKIGKHFLQRIRFGAHLLVPYKKFTQRADIFKTGSEPSRIKVSYYQTDKNEL